MPYEKIGNNEPVCIADEVPFEIPDSWEWCRLGSIGETNIGLTYKPSDKTESDKGVPVLRSNNIQKGKMDYNDLVYVSCPVPERAMINEGDILICARNGSRALVGKSAIVDRDGMAFGAFMAKYTSGLNGLLNAYILTFIESPVFRSQLDGVKTETINQITQDMIKEQLIPIPPLSEQKRIKDKLNEILPIVEKYNAIETECSLLNKQFPDLLKKSILQEAVQGKLVPQDENDEPASVLLDRIRAEKDVLIKSGKIKKDKNESIIFRRDNSHYEKFNGVERCIDDEIPFEIPKNWTWCRLGSILIKLSDGTHSTPKYVESGIPFISVKDVSSGKLDFSSCKYVSKEEHKELYERCNPEQGDILLTKVGTTGIPVIVDTNDEFSLFVSVALLKFNQNLLYNKYLVHLINSPLVQKQASENTKGVGNKNWVMRDIANTLIALPPLTEQYRIVSQIAEIMPFIDNLTQ